MNTVFFILMSHYSIDYQCFTDTLSPQQLAKRFQDSGSHYYDRNSRRSFTDLDSAAFYYQRANLRDQQALCLQNAGFVLQEKFNQVDSALRYTNQAIAIWRDLNSPINEANLLKYKGLLLTFLKQYEAADTAILNAERLFSLQKHPYGIAVCWFDRAILFQKQQLLDSAATYASRAKAFWQTKQDTGRIFNINNLLFNLHPNMDLIQENETLLQDKKVYWKDIFVFYQNCIDFYNKQLQAEKAHLYEKRLTDYRTACRANGIAID
jgi:tetratricopeptide (TPR) repeat protein